MYFGLINSGTVCYSAYYQGLCESYGGTKSENSSGYPMCDLSSTYANESECKAGLAYIPPSRVAGLVDMDLETAKLETGTSSFCAVGSSEYRCWGYGFYGIFPHNYYYSWAGTSSYDVDNYTAFNSTVSDITDKLIYQDFRKFNECYALKRNPNVGYETTSCGDDLVSNVRDNGFDDVVMGAESICEKKSDGTYECIGSTNSGTHGFQDTIPSGQYNTLDLGPLQNELIQLVPSKLILARQARKTQWG